MDISTISAAVSSLKVAKDIAQGMLHLSNIAEVQSKVIELQSAILDAQGKALDAQADLVSISQELAAAKSEIAALNSHRDFVATLSRHDGAYLAPGDPDPFCPRCVEASTTPIHLFRTSKMELRHWIWACPQCKTQMPWSRPVNPNN
ncbi:hypothetical protein [Xanthomonas medicagonis]|uniref:hypothetical protein n=1 Tax=Xanthomonas medicagonis TaxID=3160841 RepID=UPI003512B89E